jgi:hypothetical protein
VTIRIRVQPSESSFAVLFDQRRTSLFDGYRT